MEYGDGVLERLRDALPDGVDAAFDLIGGPVLSAVAELVTDRGRLISAVSPDLAAELGGAAVRQDRSVRVLAEVGRLAAEGRLNPQVTSVVDFQDAAEAIATVESGHPWGKVVLRIS